VALHFVICVLRCICSVLRWRKVAFIYMFAFCSTHGAVLRFIARMRVVFCSARTVLLQDFGPFENCAALRISPKINFLF
jgi:hypothetical protein